jgi:nucleotide-binding universal stress UspA family protein
MLLERWHFMYKKILVALDGSEYSLTGGQIAIAAAQYLGAEIHACHVYDVRIHSRRLTEMEPMLPVRYRKEEVLSQVRAAHNELIVEGFQALSKGYMDAFLETALDRGIPVSQVHREGRNYVEIIKVAEEYQADLVVLGSLGLGAGQGDSMGSTSARVLGSSRCDVLVARRTPAAGKVVAGIDGSREAMRAMQKAVMWARILEKPLELVAAYDPYFHAQVFKTMAGALSRERQEQVGLAKQETLHEELVDEGLGKLYRSFLDQAAERCRAMGADAETALLRGKAYRALVEHEGEGGVDLLVLGRFGNHREEAARIGSNSEAACRSSKTNVLVAAPSGRREPTGISPGMNWDQEALARLERIPPAARPMAKQGIEAYARSKGKSEVSLEDMKQVASRLGMGEPRERQDDRNS